MWRIPAAKPTRAGDVVELYAGQSVAVFGRACARNPENPPSAFNMERRGAQVTEAAEDLQLEPSWKCYSRQQRAVRQCGQLSRARLCAVLRWRTPPTALRGRRHRRATVGRWSVSAGFQAVPVGRGGRPGVRRMVQDLPRRVLTAPKAVLTAVRGGVDTARGAGRKTPAAPSSRFCPHRKRPCRCCSTSSAHQGQAYRGKLSCAMSVR